MCIRLLFAGGLLLGLLACSKQAPTEPATAEPAGPMPVATVGAPHRASWEVDGQAIRIEADRAVGMRLPAIGRDGLDHVVIEVRSADESAQLKLDLFVARDAELDGEYSLLPMRGPGQGGEAGQASLLLTTTTGTGRSHLPAGEGLVLIERQDELLVATFSFAGDGRFRPSDADPVTGELRVRRSMTRL